MGIGETAENLLVITFLLSSCSGVTVQPGTPLALPSPTLLPTPSPTPALIETVSGGLLSQLNYLEANLPGAGSNDYLIPTQNETSAFAGLVLAVEAGDLKHAVELAGSTRYQLVRYLDQGQDNAANYLLMEETPIRKGWGMYVFREVALNNLIIEAPHPLADKGTARVALDIYRVLKARALLIAGAHRDANRDGSADVANVPTSIFQSVHETLVSETQSTPGMVVVLQIHGFTPSKHTGYPQVVIGYDRQAPKSMGLLVNEIKAALVDRGLHVGVCDGKSWQDLCGTKNIQASTSNGGLFIHLELDESVRSEDAVLVAALAQVSVK